MPTQWIFLAILG